MDEMNVVMVAYHSCIRVIKESLALRDAGINVKHLTHHFGNEDLKTCLSDVSFYSNPQDLKHKLAFMEGVDLIHCHNEPSWIVSAAKDARPDLPVIFDVHDLASQQEEGGFNYDARLESEAEAFLKADGYIFPSYGYQEKVTMEYGLMKPSMVLYPYCNRDLLFLHPLPRVGGIVYEGGVIAPHSTAHGNTDVDRTVDYRNHLDLAKYLTSEDIPFTVYGAGKSALGPYIEAGAICFPTMPYIQMIRQLTRYDWGFVGAIRPNRAIEDCMPNKLFEYLMAGIPAIVFNAHEAGRFVEERGIGIHLNEIGEIKQRYGEWEELKKNVLKIRDELVMENHIEDVMDFYGLARVKHKKQVKDELKSLGVRL
jgi:hypothetical protein